MHKFPELPSNVHRLIPRTAFRARVTPIKSSCKIITSTSGRAANESFFEFTSGKVIRLYPTNDA